MELVHWQKTVCSANDDSIIFKVSVKGEPIVSLDIHIKMAPIAAHLNAGDIMVVTL